ncbi:MAG TPA: DUF5715 family protein [Vicinamibacterales bacterium]|nr:DUF5715 family protein [Vicinamibacterales bacterium]
MASRVRSGALEVTSLVRHDAYQRALARRNANARTRVPTHTMGLAFDISILHAPLETAMEIRDVLEQLAADGDLLFVAEQRQLVFHVVPTPQRRDHYAAVAHVMTTAPPATIEAPQPAVTGLRVAAVRKLPLPPTPRPDLQPLAPAHYAGLFGWLFVSGLGVPPGEDLLLASAGALVGHGVFAWWPVMLLALISVVASDAIWFSIGRTTARLSRRSRIIPARVGASMDRFIGRWGRLAIALARFIPGSRAIVFGSAGARGIRPRTFLLIDTVAALAWVALIVSLGTWVISLFSHGQILLPSGVRI